MNATFEFALNTRLLWLEGKVLEGLPGCEALAKDKCEEATHCAFAYGWGVSQFPSKFFEDVPELNQAFLEGRQTMDHEIQ
ncbi:hypothetical protein [Pseudomonas lactis]|uniref:hypothetical protein n=1 Tax=Pseudomonas lactis TaxID=1615674 RepID=UPI003F81ADFA